MGKKVDVKEVGIKEAAAKLLNGDAVVVEYTKLAWPVEVDAPVVRGLDYPDWLSEGAERGVKRVKVLLEDYSDVDESELPEWLIDVEPEEEPEVIVIERDDLPEWLQPIEDDCDEEAHDCEEFAKGVAGVLDTLDKHKANALVYYPPEPEPKPRETTEMSNREIWEIIRADVDAAMKQIMRDVRVSTETIAESASKPHISRAPVRAKQGPNYPVVERTTGRRVNLATGQVEHPYEAITDPNEAGRLSPNLKSSLRWVKQNLTEPTRSTAVCTADRGWVRTM